MQRRTWLKLGGTAGVLLALAGAGAALWTPGWRDDKLSPPARALFGAVAGVVLDGSLPDAPAPRAAALQAQLERLEASLRGLAPATREQLSQLLAVLCTAPGRLALTGLSADWSQATPAQVASSLQSLRTSPNTTRQQVYHGLRDLTNAAYFADPGTWAAIGYPGPQAV
ncbi:MAG TPA: hypothetical protein VLA61_17005 [Ideonella sp.]|uniref:hypothetical protein n=1 Tax=Ideonella sp. TaxID=1929293 RepID=UPI002C7E8B2B|nr:hypothetical protein [Ideonella sp.]HSI49974.1 hypothetical protein [Ideonella sp.]